MCWHTCQWECAPTLFHIPNVSCTLTCPLLSSWEKNDLHTMKNYCLGIKNSVSVTQLTGSQIYVLVQTLRWGCSLLRSGEIWLMCCIFWSEATLESGACPKKAGTSPTQVIDLNSSEHLECQLVDLALLGDSLLTLNKRTLAASTELCCMLENSLCLPCKT